MATEPAHVKANSNTPGSQVLEQIAGAIRDIRFGSVEIVIHDGEVVQIERRDKIRPAPGRKQK